MGKSGVLVPLAFALVAAACGGGSSPVAELDQPASEDMVADGVNGEERETEPVLVQRSASRLIVVASIPEMVSLVEEVASLEFVDEIVPVSDAACAGGGRVECVADVSSLAPTSGRQVIVSLDGPSAALALEPLFSATAAIVVVASPEDAALRELAEAASGVAVQVVPPDLETVAFVPPDPEAVVSPEEVALLIGARDEVAAYEVLEVSAGVFVAVVQTVLEGRVEALDTPAEVEDTAPGDIPEPVVRWTVEIPAPSGFLGLHNSAALADGILAFLGSDGVARGLDAASGDELWATPIVPDPRINPAAFAAIAGDTVLMGMGNSLVEEGNPAESLWALDLHTGEVRWTVETAASGAVGHPATAGERVYVWLALGPEDQALRALDLATGDELWRLEEAVGAGPLRIEDGVIWATNTNGTLLGVDASNGDEVLRFETVAIGPFGSSSRPAVAGHLVMFGSDSGTFFAVDRNTGEEIWTFVADGPDLPSSPAIAGDVVVFGAFDDNVYGLDIATGALRWEYPAVDAVLSSPVVADGVVYVGSFRDRPAVHAIDAATGEAIWRLPVDENVSASPVVDEDLVYIYTASRVYAIER